MSRTHEFTTEETCVLVSDEKITLCFDNDKVVIRGRLEAVRVICRSMASQAGVRLHHDELMDVLGQQPNPSGT